MINYRRNTISPYAREDTSNYALRPRNPQDRETDWDNPFRQGGEFIPIPRGNSDLNNQMTPIESSRYSLLQQLLWRQERPSLYEATEELDVGGKRYTNKSIARAPWADENDRAIAGILAQLKAIDDAELTQLKATAEREQLARASRLESIGMTGLLEATDPLERYAYFQVLAGQNPGSGPYLSNAAAIDAEGNAQAAALRYQGALVGADARRYAADRGAQGRVDAQKIKSSTDEIRTLITAKQAIERELQRAKGARAEQLQLGLRKIEKRLTELQGVLKSLSSDINRRDLEASSSTFDSDVILGQEPADWSEWE